MHKIILLLLVHVLSAQADAFGDFAKTNYFSEIDPSFLQLTAECRKNFDKKKNKKPLRYFFTAKESTCLISTNTTAPTMRATRI